MRNRSRTTGVDQNEGIRARARRRDCASVGGSITSTARPRILGAMGDAYTTKSRKIMTVPHERSSLSAALRAELLLCCRLAAALGESRPPRLPPAPPVHDDPGCITCPLLSAPPAGVRAGLVGRRWHYGGRIAVLRGVWEGILIQHATHDVGPTMTAPIPALIFHRFYSRPFPSPHVRPTWAPPSRPFFSFPASPFAVALSLRATVASPAYPPALELP